MSACCRFAGPVWTGLNPQFDYRMGGAGAAYRSSKVALIALTVGCAQALAAHGSFKVNALAPDLCATNLNSPAAEPGGDPAETAAQAVSLSRLSAEVPTGGFFSWDGTVAAWWGVQPLSMLSSSLAGGCRRSGSGTKSIEQNTQPAGRLFRSIRAFKTREETEEQQHIAGVDVAPNRSFGLARVEHHRDSINNRAGTARGEKMPGCGFEGSKDSVLDPGVGGDAVEPQRDSSDRVMAGEEVVRCGDEKFDVSSVKLDQQSFAGREVPIQSALADPGSLCHGVETERSRGVDECTCGFHDPDAVTERIGARATVRHCTSKLTYGHMSA